MVCFLCLTLQPSNCAGSCATSGRQVVIFTQFGCQCLSLTASNSPFLHKTRQTLLQAIYSVASALVKTNLPHLSIEIKHNLSIRTIASHSILKHSWVCLQCLPSFWISPRFVQSRFGIGRHLAHTQELQKMFLSTVVIHKFSLSSHISKANLLFHLLNLLIPNIDQVLNEL